MFKTFRPSPPPPHMCVPRPLVIDADHGLIRGGQGRLRHPDPQRLELNRSALELLRLWLRFRGRVLLLSSLPQDWALWLSETLGIPGAVQAVGRRAGDRAEDAVRRFGMRGFEFLGGPETIAVLGAGAARLWLLGDPGTLQAQMRTLGVPLIVLDTGDAVALRDLAGRGAGGWPLDRPRSDGAREQRGLGP
ncbi:hypothetical protein [Mangrovicoccus algicola]|uniref:Uncharacterized protein n=1 Tax=Mangrovicoccus algicola TaxID=2771008 RepID=A0A8J6YU75_9RHOB|nr:hypothetical protein [Mangrovicoccus algicola]MBE3637795.1 hypothetical protein [Mangrovicoccus algicola]